MLFSLLTLAHVALAARPFLNEPPNGYEEFYQDLAPGALPPLETIAGLPDFEFAARNYLPLQNYTYYRNGAGGEWSYRNNLEVFHRYSFHPRVLMGSRNLESTLKTTILGHNFSAPFFISPAARAVYGHPNGEQNLVQAAGESGILYVPSLLASNSIESISTAKAPGQVLFQQMYLPDDMNETESVIRRIEATGAAAIFLTVDAPTSGDRQRAYRLRGGPPDIDYTHMTWDTYDQIKAMTTLPVIPKGILTVQDARLAIQHGAPGIFISNHGARQLDGAPSSLEVALAIHREAPEIFEQTEVYADGGVRYGTDVLKLLALGVRAVGLARPFMYANVYGLDGVRWAIKLLRRELLVDAANLGVADLSRINSSYVNWDRNGWIS